jgi:hypothetical protein
MPFCRRCGKQLPSDATFCSECGAAVTAPTPLQVVSPAIPESKIGRNIVVAVVLISLLLVVGALGYQAYEASKPSPTTERETTTISVSSSFVDESPYIEYGSAWHSSTVYPKGMTIHVSVRVQEGGPIDVLLMNSGDFLNFENLIRGGEAGNFQYLKKGSALNVKSIDYEFTIPSDDRYFVVLNNAGRIEGGAVPVGPVTVHIKIVVSL